MPDWEEEITRRLRSLKLAPAREAEIVEEVAQHLEDRYHALVAGGMTEDEARRVVFEELSDEDLLARGLRRVEQEVPQEPIVPGGGGRNNFLASIWQDIRYGMRMLRKGPGFTAVAVLSLGLGIGANTTIFSFVSALLFRPPAIEQPDQLLEVWQRDPRASGLDEYTTMSYPGYVYYREHNQVLSGLAGFGAAMTHVTWGGAAEGGLVQAQLVSGNFFQVLGVEPNLGRAFSPEEDQLPPAQYAVVLSHAFWQQRLGSNPRIIGKTITLNGKSFSIVGVAPPRFTGIIVGNEPDLWAPLAATPEFTHDTSLVSAWNSSWLFAVGRLKPGTKASRGQADLNVLAKRLQQDHPESNKGIEAATFPVNLVPRPIRGYVAAISGIFMTIVGLVLLIACANAANLLLAKAVSRRREIAVRSALGASRGRLLRQTLTEGVLLSSMGGIVGLLVAFFAIPPLLALKPASLPVRVGVSIDWRVLTFTFVLGFATGIVVGLAPALRSSKLNLVPALKDEVSSAGFHRSWLRSILVVAQVSVCSVVLMGAALCTRSLINARSVDPGFDTQHTVIAEVDPGSLGYSESNGKGFYRELVGRVEALPGVKSASLASYLPLGTENQKLAIAIGEREADVDLSSGGPRFCETMGMTLLRGRDVTETDAGAKPSPVIINDAMARRFWPGQDPIGKRFGFVGDKTHSGLIVVGVVRTGKYHALSEDPQPFMYQFFEYSPHATLVVRTEGDPRALVSSVRRTIHDLDPNVVPLDVETMKQYMVFPLFPTHTTGLLLGAFGILALVLAVTGLYGVVSYAVSQGTREVGIRMALGAAQKDVLRLVLQHGMALTLIGVSLGVLLSLAATRVLSGLLYGIRPTDPLTFVVVSVILTTVSLAASYIPARRATKVDPMVALRYE